MAPPRRMTPRSTAPIAVGLAVLLLAVVAAVVTRGALTAERERRSRATASAQGDAIRALIHQGGDLAGRLSALDDDDARRAVALLTEGTSVVVGAAFADRQGDSAVVRTVLRPGAGLSPAHEVDARFRPLLPLALDRSVVVSGPHRTDGRTTITAVAARFDGGDEPASVLDRRRGATGYSLLVLNIAVRPPGAASLTGPEGDIGRWQGEGRAGQLLATSFDVRGRTWNWAVGSPAPPAALPLGLALAGLPLAAVTAAATRRQMKALARAEQRARERADELQLIGRASTQLQQSFDLGELLPTFAVEIAEDFELVAVTVSVAEEDGEFVEVFRFGDDRGSAQLGHDSASENGLPAGAATVLPLRRGWRTVGSLGIRAGRDLDATQLSAVKALAELLAVAVTNSQLFQREHEAAAQLRELDTLKNAFLGTVSHELRTPTAAITGFADLLDQHWDDLEDGRRRDLARRIGRNALSLRHLIDALLDFARLEQERLVITPQMVSLSEVVVQATEQMHPLVPDRELDVRVEPGVTAWADPFAVERVLANLLSNAGKYTPVSSTVTVEVHAIGDCARLTVSDQGPGIAEADRARIFNRFFRGSDDVTVRTRGVGIGLAILSEVAAASGAQVSVEDAPGGGARFVIDFPRTEPASDQRGDGREVHDDKRS